MTTTQVNSRQLAREASAGRSLDDYPLRLDARHMSEIFGVGLKQIYKLDAQGALLRFQNVPRIGRKSWSRDPVKAYFAGENDAARRPSRGRP